MANRSNRRRQNPQVSRCAKHVEAIGSRRANSPSWPSIESVPKSEAEYTCAVGTGAKAKEACNEEESIYGHRDAREKRVDSMGIRKDCVCVCVCVPTRWLISFPRTKSRPVDTDPIKEDKNNENIIHRFARNFIANSNITILRR